MNSPSRFEVIPLGVGNFFSSFRYCSSLLLQAGDQRVLVDCPDPFFRMLHDASGKSGRTIRASDLDDVILTHLHGDHCNGLESFGFFRRFVCQRGTRPRIHTSVQAGDGLWAKLESAMGRSHCPELRIDDRSTIEDYFDIRKFEIGATIRVGGIEFETRRTLHTVPTFGFRAKFAGRIFGYSCDTSFDPGMIKFLEPAHLIFHECDKGIHTDQARLAELPESFRSRMHLVHMNDEFNGTDRLRPAEEGRVYKV